MKKTTQAVRKFSNAAPLTVENLMEFVSEAGAPLNARVKTYSGLDHRAGGFVQEVTLVWDVD